MAGLDPAIHVFLFFFAASKDVDARVKCLVRGHDRRVFGDIADTS